LSLINVVAIAVGLALDAFAVSIGAAAAGHVRSSRAAFRLWFHFGLFQMMMPVIGWFAGGTIAPHVATWDHWIAFALLCWVGAKLIHESLSRKDTDRPRTDPTRGRTMVALSVATSIDALAVGFGFACLGQPIWPAAAIIGVVAAIFAYVGCRLGDHAGRAWGRRVGVVGGVVLILVGLRILLQHLTA
jgi:putative Mn2+ efflux pump MntP